jgi:hypothetical protein
LPSPLEGGGPAGVVVPKLNADFEVAGVIDPAGVEVNVEPAPPNNPEVLGLAILPKRVFCGACVVAAGAEDFAGVANVPPDVDVCTMLLSASDVLGAPNNPEELWVFPAPPKRPPPSFDVSLAPPKSGVDEVAGCPAEVELPLGAPNIDVVCAVPPKRDDVCF